MVLYILKSSGALCSSKVVLYTQVKWCFIFKSSGAIYSSKVALLYSSKVALLFSSNVALYTQVVLYAADKTFLSVRHVKNKYI